MKADRKKPKAKGKGARKRGEAKPPAAAETPETAETAETAKAKGGAKALKKGPHATKVEKGSSARDAPKKASQQAEAGRKGAPKKGERRGGRDQGTPNKRTLELRQLLETNGLTDTTHPVVMMMRVYLGEITMPVVVRKSDGDETWNEVEDVPLEPGLRIKCMAEVAQYLEPKRKAIELTGAGGAPLEVRLLNLAELEPSGVGVKKP